MLLRSMRNGFFSALFLGLLVMGGISLIFTDWNGMFHGGINKTDLAKVDGTPIKIAEFNNRVNNILRQQQINPSAAYQMGLIDNILRQEIFEILLKKDAADLGIRVEDRIIADQVRDMISPLKKDGVADKDALKKFLEMQGMSEAQLTSALRDDLTTKILKATITSGAYIPKSLIDNILAYKNETRSVDVSFFPNASISITGKPTDADLEKYYQGIQSSFMIPEYRDVTIAVLDTSKIGKPTISDADVKAAYEDNQDDYTSPMTADIEQSLVSDEDKAQKIVDAVKSGKSMKEATTSVMGNEKSFQGKNTFSKNGLPTNIATPVFDGKSGDVIGPVKSAMGFHIIKLVKINAASPVPFAQVQDKIRAELEDEKSGDAVYNVTSKIEDRLANGDKFEDMKSEYPLTLISLKKLTKSTKPPKELDFAGKDSDIILAKAFATGTDAPSQLSDINKTKLFSVRVDKLSPATAKPFADVKSAVMASWVADNQAQENLLSTQKLVDDLNSGASKSVPKMQTIASFTRSGNSGVAKDITDRLMSADKGQYIMAISKEKNGIYIGRVNSITLPKGDSKTEESTKAQLESDLASSSYMGYLGALQNKYSVTINDDLLKRVYGTKQDSE